MIDSNRRIARRLATALAAAAFSLALPTGALAERGHHGRGHGQSHGDQGPGYSQSHGDRGPGYLRSPGGSHGRPHRGDHHSFDQRRHGHYRSHDSRWGHHRPRPYPVHVHGASCSHDRSDYGYYCQPCGHRYDSLGRLHYHVSHAHHIPFWRLPFVIFAKAMGFYYYG
jgi:hypothetical protein